jgi:hypothetical protein
MTLVDFIHSWLWRILSSAALADFVRGYPNENRRGVLDSISYF